MVINNGRANVWAGTMVNVSVRGNDGILEVMKPQINYAPAMLVGKVVVSEGAVIAMLGVGLAGIIEVCNIFITPTIYLLLNIFMLALGALMLFFSGWHGIWRHNRHLVLDLSSKR